MIYVPHSATVYVVASDGYTYSTAGTLLPGHLTKRDFSSTLQETGWNATETATYIFEWEDYYKVKQGDRLLVDGAYWNVVSPVQQRDEIYILRESRVLLEKTEEN